MAETNTPKTVRGRSTNVDEQTLADIAQDIETNGYALTFEQGKWIIKDPARNEIFAVIDDNGDYFLGTAEDVRVNYLEDAKKTKGGIEGLRRRLYDAQYITEGDLKTKNATALSDALTRLGRDVANDLWNSYESDIPYKTPLNTFLKSRAISLQEEPSVTRVATVRFQANQDINDFFMQMAGIPTTKAQRQEYFKLLQEAEKSAVRKSQKVGDTAVVSDTLLDEEDLFEIRAKVLRPAIKNTPLEKITAAGGRIAQQITNLKEYAAAYGINLSTESAYSQIQQQFKRGAVRDLSQQQAQVREMAKAFYPNLADLIDKNVSIQDIADPFIQQKAAILELPRASINALDPDIQKALHNVGADGSSKGPGVMSLTQAQSMFRQDPRFMNTKTAVDSAYSWLNVIGKMFGKIG